MNSSLNPIAFAMRHPVSVMAGMAALAVASLLATQRMAVDVFPAFDLPVINIAKPYVGMDPSQMESQLTSFCEGHSIYMTGIHRVESKNIQGMAVIKLAFYPGTDMAGAIAEAVGYTVRAKGFMPPGTLPPFILRYDSGSVPVGYLVIDSDQARSVGEMSDQQDDQAWVVRLVANKVVRTRVRLGLRDRQRLEVLREQRHSVEQRLAAEWEDFTDTDLVVRHNPSTFADVRPSRTSRMRSSN
jgi:Cu/Ag efflux pump CusA